MYCTKCNKPVSWCSCDDFDEKLKKLAFRPDNDCFIFQWCRNCDKHYDRCTCQTPDFFFISGGEEININDIRKMTTLQDLIDGK